MASLFKLRRSEPALERSFRAPLYPWFPGVALLGALICLLAMLYSNAVMGAVFVGSMTLGYVYFRLSSRRRAAENKESLAEAA
jgi:ethanolamine permease